MVPNRIIAFLIYNMKHKNIFSKRKSTVLFFTIAFLAMGGYCVATKAQTTQIASTLEKLKGQEVTKENYTQFVTNGEKPSSMKDALFNGQAKNMFLLYNKGTGKFLTFGGYWGASATLSDTPCPFWLQSRNDTKETQGSYVRYPEKTGETVSSEKGEESYTNSEQKFPVLTTPKPFYFGSQEGNNRSHAIYKSIQIVKSGGTTTDIKVKKTEDTSDDAYQTASSEAPFIPNGKKFKSEELNVDFDKGDKIVVKIDLSNCMNNAENILSIGTKIEEWNNVGDDMIHVYFIKSSRTFNIDRTYGYSQTKETTTITDLTDITITLTKKTLSIVENSDAGTKQEFPITKSFYFGSQQGNNRSNAIYKSIQIVKSGGTTTDIKVKKTEDTSDDAYQTASSEAPFIPNGKKFKSEALDVDFDKGDKIVIKLNLNACPNNVNAANILSIGTNIETWSKNGENMVHVYFTKSSKTFNIDRTWGEASDQINKKTTTIASLDDVTITLSKDDFTISSQKHGYTIPYKEGKAGTFAKFKYENNAYVLDNEGNLQLTDDASGKGFYDTNTGSENYTYADTPDDVNPTFFISRSIHSNEDGVDPFLAYATIRYGTYNSDNGLSEKMAGVYTDKPIYSTGDNGKKYNPEYARWQFIPTGTTGEYRLALHMNVNLETGLGYAEVNDPSKTKEATYYMTASSGYIKGDTKAIKEDDKQHYLYSTVDKSGNRTYIKDFSDRYEMVKMTETPEQSGNYAIWKLITAHDYLFMLNSQQSALKETIDLSAVLADPDFSRHNDGLKNWKKDETLINASKEYNNAKLRIGYDGNYKTTLEANSYTYGAEEQWNFNDAIDRGRTNNNFCANHSRYMCATVQNRGYGRMYQSITIDSPGWYIVRCQGLTTINAYLYATVKEGNAKAENEFKCDLRKITDEYLRNNLQILDAKDAYWPYDQASPMYNAAVDMNDEHVQPNHVKESTSQVLFYVESASPSAPATVTFGVNIPQQTTYETANNGTRSYSKDFTAFDNFRLLYGGQERNEPFLILNENDENLDYLDQTIHKYKSHGDIRKKLLLHRTFTKNSWNTIILPVGLTQEQFKGAFGENAQIAELSTLTASQIRFKTISNSTKVTAPDGTSYNYWLKPMTPYLIKINDEGYEAPKNTDEYTAYLFNCADNGMTYQTKTIGGPDNAYYSIDDITMIEGEGFAKTKQEGNFNHWDFKDMTQSNIDGTQKAYSYVIKGQETNAEVNGGKMTAYGMLTRNYTKDATSGKNTLLPGHSPMTDAYIMTADKTTNKPVLKYKTGGGASKGFRCWFRYSTTESSAAKPQFALFIDGISEPTSIEDIMNNDEGITPAEKFANGIYSLNGQKVGDSEAAWNHLPKGIYIVNGKKVIK